MNKQQSRRKVVEEKSRKLFVVGLGTKISAISKDQLRGYFEQFGAVQEIRIILDKSNRQSMKSRGFGFILFKDRDSFKKVLDVGTVHTIMGKQVGPSLSKHSYSTVQNPKN